jgi:hypothetical protein
MHETSQRNTERRIEHGARSDGVTNAEIRKRSSMDTGEVADSLNRKRAGHVARTDERRWAQATSLGQVRIGKRRRGRSKTP